jgi:hypothetical protein
MPAIKIAALAALTFCLSGHAHAQTAPRADAAPPSQAASAPAPLKHTIYMHLKTRDAWLALMPPERRSYIAKNIFPILGRHPAVKVRFYDAEAYTARMSDVMVIDTSDMRQYESLIDALRTQEFWYRYFDVIDIIKTTENPLVDFANARTNPP